jgi:hypothetical protein
MFYADLQVSLFRSPMPKPPMPTEITVIWETVPDPDPHALLKAVAMLFNRQVPLSTDGDLTPGAGPLLCKRTPDS